MNQCWCRYRRCARIAVAVALPAVACGAPEDPAVPPYAATDSAGVSIVTIASVADLAAYRPTSPLVDLGAPDGREEELFSFVRGALRLDDGRLVVGDNGSRKIRVFDPEGTHLVSVGGEGEGPGEFKFIAGLWRTADSLFVYDGSSRRITVYGLDNLDIPPAVSGLSNQGPNPPQALGRLDSGAFVLAGRVFRIPETGFEPIPYVVALHGPGGALIDTIARWESGRMGIIGHRDRGMVGPPMFEPGIVAAAAGDRIVMSDCRDGAYREYGPGGELRGIVRWPAGDRIVDEADVAAFRADYLDGEDEDGRRLALERLGSMPVNETYPACDMLAVDEAGRTWVRTYAPPGGDLRAWLVFDRDGSPILQVDLAPSARFASADSGHVVLIEPDDLEVEHVRVYALPGIRSPRQP